MNRTTRAVLIAAMLAAPFGIRRAPAAQADPCPIGDQPSQCEYPTVSLPGKPRVSFGCGYVEVYNGYSSKRFYILPCPGPAI